MVCPFAPVNVAMSPVVDDAGPDTIGTVVPLMRAQRPVSVVHRSPLFGLVGAAPGGILTLAPPLAEGLVLSVNGSGWLKS